MYPRDCRDGRAGGDRSRRVREVPGYRHVSPFYSCVADLSAWYGYFGTGQLVHIYPPPTLNPTPLLRSRQRVKPWQPTRDPLPCYSLIPPANVLCHASRPNCKPGPDGHANDGRQQAAGRCPRRLARFEHQCVDSSGTF
ncbi:hypothetical protein CSHISOI_08295 [Colletotrichum shisoi]|uniref:Uncharacterized protein n=1 Tax=Colletotrichum shisoi TaxID=2078593 RepID=A0A5Q4BKP7_9PEZI|nr:hypothetical protein CSHISOI_08295 [Colletotrichum shisoi]